MSLPLLHIASDHAGFELKQKLVAALRDQYQLEDYGCATTDSVNYPDFAHSLCQKLTDDETGILVCGSGQGMCMTANKYPHIRAALVHNLESAKLTRGHNNANVICLGARVLSFDGALECIKIFLQTEFEGGRHLKRTELIPL